MKHILACNRLTWMQRHRGYFMESVRVRFWITSCMNGYFTTSEYIFVRSKFHVVICFLIWWLVRLWNQHWSHICWLHNFNTQNVRLHEYWIPSRYYQWLEKTTIVYPRLLKVHWKVHCNSQSYCANISSTGFGWKRTNN